jgi:hypothetical protein
VAKGHSAARGAGGEDEELIARCMACPGGYKRKLGSRKDNIVVIRLDGTSPTICFDLDCLV